MLGDTVPGSVENQEDLAKAGGSSAAGFGRFVFGEGGRLYRAEDGKVSWQVLSDSLEPVFGRKSYRLDDTRDYSAVVSPNQEWVAFALRSKDGKSIELWIGRIRYRNQGARTGQP